MLERWRVHRDRRALQHLVSAHGERVEQLAAVFARFDVAHEDLVQEGMVGLLTAIARFDAAREGRLADYAISWVKMQMIRFVVASVTPLRIEVRRIAAALGLAGACRSLDDKRARRSIGALVDPAPNAEERIASGEEDVARERSLAARLARLTAEERALVGAIHLGEPRPIDAATADAGELEWTALSKLLVAPGERSAAGHVLVGGRRRRLNREHGARSHRSAALGGG